MTRVLQGLTFFLGFTSLSLLGRLARRDRLEERDGPGQRPHEPF